MAFYGDQAYPSLASRGGGRSGGLPQQFDAPDYRAGSRARPTKIYTPQGNYQSDEGYNISVGTWNTLWKRFDKAQRKGIKPAFHLTRRVWARTAKTNPEKRKGKYLGYPNTYRYYFRNKTRKMVLFRKRPRKKAKKRRAAPRPKAKPLGPGFIDWSPAMKASHLVGVKRRNATIARFEKIAAAKKKAAQADARKLASSALGASIPHRVYTKVHASMVRNWKAFFAAAFQALAPKPFMAPWTKSPHELLVWKHANATWHLLNTGPASLKPRAQRTYCESKGVMPVGPLLKLS